MITRILPPDEWLRLHGTELETVWPVLPPTAQVLIVEDEGAIVGCWALFPCWHAEGLFIAPAYRGKSAVARRLWTGLQRLARACGIQAVTTGACSDEVRGLLTHVGAVPLPGAQFVLTMGGD